MAMHAFAILLVAQQTSFLPVSFTGLMTILAGLPWFSRNWGRHVMMLFSRPTLRHPAGFMHCPFLLSTFADRCPSRGTLALNMISA